MFFKGRSFIMAGGLVKAYEGHRFVYLHLLCQGLECVGKAILLLEDHERYASQLRSEFGHDLEVLVNELNSCQADIHFSENALEEVRMLNFYYKRHLLRYGGEVDFERDASNIKADILHREVVEVLPLLNPKFSGIATDA